MLGTAGLPHILMRFYTVPDARTARSSVTYATAFIGFFYLLTFILGFGAMVIVGQPAIRAIDAGGNMAAPLLAEAVGGEGFLGFIAAVAFATILAVVAGLTLAGAAALSHDLWVNVVRHGAAPEHEQLRVARGSTVLLGVARHRARHRVQGAERRLHGGAGVRDCGERELSGAGAVGVLARGSRRAARRRACSSGTASSLLLIYLSPTIQIDILGNTAALVPACATPASSRSRCPSPSRLASRSRGPNRPLRRASPRSSSGCTLDGTSPCRKRGDKGWRASVIRSTGCRASLTPGSRGPGLRWAVSAVSSSGGSRGTSRIAPGGTPPRSTTGMTSARQRAAAPRGRA